MENMSLSDIAAVTKDGDGMFGGNGGMWIFALLILLLIGGGGFFGNRNAGDYSQYATAASQQEILFGQQFQNVDNKLDRIGNGICDSTYALNNAITSESRSIVADICNLNMNTQKNIDALRFDMSNYNASTNAAIHAEGEATRAMLQQNKIESLQNQVNQLQLQSAMCGVVRYPLAMTYSSSCNPFCPSSTTTA